MLCQRRLAHGFGGSAMRTRVEPLAFQTAGEGMYFKAWLWHLAGTREEPKPVRWPYRVGAERAEEIRRHARELATLLSDPPDTPVGQSDPRGVPGERARGGSS